MSVLLLTTLIPNLAQLLPALISQWGALIYIGLFLVIFIETGVVILPFLPGDSLLFLCGSLAALANGGLNIWILWGLLVVAAFVGDSLNFEIGEHFGGWLTHNQKLQRFIKPEYLDRSAKFFAKHGKAAIFLGRFMPIIRTFIPFTAGISKMHYRSFVFYNLLGGIAWVTVALGAGFFFGNVAIVKAHFELIMIAIIIISLLPAAIMALRNKKGGRVDVD